MERKSTEHTAPAVSLFLCVVKKERQKKGWQETFFIRVEKTEICLSTFLDSMVLNSRNAVYLITCATAAFIDEGKKSAFSDSVQMYAVWIFPFHSF